MADNSDDKPKKKKASVPPPPSAAFAKAKGIGPDPGPRMIGAEPMSIPGVQAGANKLANLIDPTAGVGGYGRGFAAGAVQGLGNMVATGLDPRNVSEAGAPVGSTESPLARFVGWMRGAPEHGIDHIPLYNVEAPGHPLDRSTVSPQTLIQHNIPFTPPPPPAWEQPTAVTGQGMQVPNSFFNKPQAEAPSPQPDPMDRLVGRFGGRGPASAGPVTSDSIAAAKAARNSELEDAAAPRAARNQLKLVKGNQQ